MAEASKKPEVWDEVTTEEWWQEVESWPWQYDSKNNSWFKSGKCPRCDHIMSRGLGKPVIGPFVDLPEEVDIACNCDKAHPKRPDGKRGCGQAAIISGPRDM